MRMRSLTRSGIGARALILSCALALGALSLACSDTGGAEGGSTPADVTTTGPITGTKDRVRGAVDSLNGQQADLEERTASQTP